MPEQDVTVEPGARGKLRYDKERRTIVGDKPDTETAIQKALRWSGIELSILIGLDDSPIPADVRDGMRKTLALIDEAAPAAAVAEEHYQAAMAMGEKHRKNWVEACQERDGEREGRAKLDKALREKDAAMGVLFERLVKAGVDCSDLIS